MEPRIIAVREEVGLAASFSLNSGAYPQDLTGWTFACVLTRQAGTSDITLGMAVGAGDGFAIATPPSAGIYTVTIAAATLQDVTDTTGDFTLYGTIFGTDVDEVEHFIEDLQLNVTRFPGT